jgi:hypothetical protein
MMKIILVTTDTRRKNLVFVSEELKSFSPEEAIKAMLYHQGYGKPHPEPEPDERGKQIAKEFYRLSKRWLQKK